MFARRSLKTRHNKKLQIFDLLQMSKKEREALLRARRAVAEYKTMRRERSHAFSDYIGRLQPQAVAQTS